MIKKIKIVCYKKEGVLLVRSKLLVDFLEYLMVDVKRRIKIFFGWYIDIYEMKIKKKYFYMIGEWNLIKMMYKYIF